LRAGDVLSTSSGALLALEWNDGASLRLDENTELVLHTEDEIELIQGRIYVDSGVDRAAAAPVSLSIQTHAGMVRHIGTQYLTAVQTAGIVVSVREGEVQVRPESGAASVRPGEQLSVSLDGEITQQVIPTHGAMWEWTERITPPLELDGMTALAFVQWAARETGHELVFESDAARQLAGETQLRGAVAQEPQRALYLILQTSDLEHEVSGGNILVRIRAGAG